MLLIQCEETERVTLESEELKEQMDAVMESYERLKKKLDVKDQRLNEKDQKIAELTREMEEMKAARERELETAGSAEAAAQRMHAIFEEAKRAAEQYLSAAQRLGGRQKPFGAERAAGIRKRQSGIPRAGQIVPMNPGQTAGIERDAASGDIYG